MAIISGLQWYRLQSQKGNSFMFILKIGINELGFARCH